MEEYNIAELYEAEKSGRGCFFWDPFVVNAYLLVAKHRTFTVYNSIKLCDCGTLVSSSSLYWSSFE